jgi:hypothetical protein
MLRLLIPRALVLFVAALTWSPEPVSAAEGGPLTVHDDLRALSSLIRLPDGVPAARWLMVPRAAATRVPGPTDTLLYVVVPVDPPGWEAWRSRLTRRAVAESRSLARDVAQVLLTPGELQGLSSAPDGRVVITDVQHEAPGLATSWYASYWAARIGSELLLVFGSR